MPQTLAFIDERPDNSITAITPPINAVDAQQPLSFSEWLKYNTQVFTTTSDFLVRYQSYLANWYAVKQVSSTTASNEIQSYYANLINDIILNYSTDDERRFLKNIDTSDSRDLAAAIPFFAKKIKDICLYYSTLRDDVQTAVVRYNLKGSNAGIENLLYSFFLKSLDAKDLVEKFNTLKLNLTDIRNNLVIDVEDLYDTCSNYYDLSPTLPASAYNVTTGLRKDYFELNQQDIDPYLFEGINQSILNSILSYPFYLIELGTAISIDPLVNSSQLNLLKDSDFITTVNDGDVNSLNLSNKLLETTKYIGSDFYYIATSSTATSYTSGQLFAADSEFANFLNKRYPTIAAVPSDEFLKTARDIGLFFKPDKLGLSNFTNFNFTYNVDIENLKPDTVYYFPDPVKYGNISGNSRVNFVSPIKFFEENYFNKTDLSNQYRAGDVATDPYFQTFRAYQTRDQSLKSTNIGVSRYTDSQDFFNGEFSTIWSNPDVYPSRPISQYPVKERIEALLPLNKTLFQYKSDVYGNEYGLYKSAVNKKFDYFTTPSVTFNYLLQGGEFTTAEDSYTIANSALGFSGVTLKTSISEPASFIDGGNPIIITSFGFDTSTLPVYVFTEFYTTTYNCYVRDCQTFIAANSALLPDDDSDIDTYNPNSSNLYYNELADCAPQPNGPYGVANLTNRASFLFEPLFYAKEDYDGGEFFIEALSSGPCENEIYTHNFKEKSNYRNIAIPGRSTVVDLSLSGAATTQNSLYYMRNIEHGDLYFRNIDSTIIGPVSSVLSATFLNYPPVIRTELNNKILNFDIFFDILHLETDNFLVFDKLEFDYNTNSIGGSVKEIQALSRGDYPELEKFSNIWFNETDRALYVCKTTLLTDGLSASNYKVVYPEIYKINLNNQQTTRIFPTEQTEKLTFDNLSLFSLYGKNIEVNIVDIEKPVLTYNDENAYYNLTYLGKDTANTPYVITTRFQYINNTIINISSTMHKSSTDVYNVNFSNPEGSPFFDTYTLLGKAAGALNTSDGTYAFGSGRVGDIIEYDPDLWNYIQTAGITNQTARLHLSAFVFGLKDMGVWDKTACWIMRSKYNMGDGYRVFSLGGLGTHYGNLSASGSTAFTNATGTDYPAWEANGIRFNGFNGMTALLSGGRRTTPKHNIISVSYNDYVVPDPSNYGIAPKVDRPVHITTSLSSSDISLSLFSTNSGKDWFVQDLYTTTIPAITSVAPSIIVTDALSGTLNYKFEAAQHDSLFVGYTRDNDTVIIDTSRFPITYDRIEVSGLWTYDNVGAPYPSRAIGAPNSKGWPGIQTLVMIIDESIDVQAIRSLIKRTICSDLNLR